MMKKRVLIAGGAGFIGSNLTRKLLDQGCHVDSVDNLITGRIANLLDFFRVPSFKFLQGDIADKSIFEILKDEEYDEIYHLACPTGVPNIDLMGEEMMDASSIGTLHMLKLAIKTGAKLLYASSAEAYGDPLVSPQNENYTGNVDPIGPRSPYEVGKRFGEALVKLYSEKHGVDARIVRIFNTYGPRMSMRDQRVIPQFFHSAAAGKPIRIYGDGSQTRTFLYIDDLLRGFNTVLHKGKRGQAYNIGGDHEITIHDLYKVVEGVVGHKMNVEFRPHFITDHAVRRPDLSKVTSLGWKQETPLERGLDLVCDELIRGADSANEFVSMPRKTAKAEEVVHLAVMH